MAAGGSVIGIQGRSVAAGGCGVGIQSKQRGQLVAVVQGYRQSYMHGCGVAKKH